MTKQWTGCFLFSERRRNKGSFVEVACIIGYTLVCSSGKGDKNGVTRQGGNYEII